MIANDSRLLAVQDEIRRISQEEAQAFAGQLNNEVALAEVYRRAAKLKRRKTIVKTVSISATAVAAAFAAVIILIPSKTSIPLTASFQDSLENKAVLVLANGESIAMEDTGRQQVVAGAIPLNNNNRSLTFSTAGQKPLTGLNTLSVPAKLDFQIELVDGTKVWLNSTTKFRFPFEFAKGSREVFIDHGEAYFVIAPDANRPFTVHTSAGPVRVLGTEFNINAYNHGKVITSLISGKVAVSNGTKTIELKPGSEVIAQNGLLTENKEFDQLNTLSWRKGVHYFDNATIAEVGIMLKRWFDLKLIIDNPQAAQTEFRGKLFRNQPIDKFIQQINDTEDVTFYWANGELHCK